MRSSKDSQDTGTPPEQYDLFGGAPAVTDVQKSLPPPKAFKKNFTPPSLHNGLTPHHVTDHAMLWVRMMTKGARNNPHDFLYHQIQEMNFKKSEYDPVLVVRQGVVRSYVK